MISIGLIELNSIAQGVLATDYALKSAEVKLLFAKPVCPGKYMILFYGDVAAVETALKVGVDIGKHFVVDKLIIPNVYDSLIEAINGTTEINGVSSVGVMEYFNIVSAIIGADNAIKAADVNLINIRLGMGIGGKSFVSLCGSVSSVETAVKAGLKDATNQGTVVSSCVIPSPNEELFYSLI